ncbi:ATP-binding protein [Massilia sp. BJB1822]|uniref:ATP-binding protein n=1 Tax=Massilia sp. BJB1822 TaxID=2744470 RepID=UPI001592AFFB|nr:ATP-binding protein [Massilia sp. BJB1822]NVE00907.1 response regulator [Massilia sp. BJB1822]
MSQSLISPPPSLAAAEAPLSVPVLLVDDRPENLLAMEALLQGLPYVLDVTCAGSGNEALAISLKRDFAVVLLDVQMPDMDGLETATLLRANPKTRHLPIIFVTAGLHDELRQFKGYETGAIDFLIKPIEPVVLRSKVAVLCELYSKCRELEEHKASLEARVAERTRSLSALAAQLSEEVQARRLSEQALRDSEARLRMVIDSACEAFIAFSAAGIIIEWNQRAEELVGWPRADALGRQVLDFLNPPTAELGADLPPAEGEDVLLAAADASDDACAQAGATAPVQDLEQLLPGEPGAASRVQELCMWRRDGSHFALELSVWPIPDSEPPLYGCLLRDITTRREQEEAHQRTSASLQETVAARTAQLRQAMDQLVDTERMAALGGIVAAVAHDLNTPVGNLVLLASALRERIAALATDALEGHLTRSRLCEAVADCKEGSGLLIRSAERAQELIESFKNVAVDQTSQKRRQFDLAGCVHDIAATLGRMTRMANVKVELKIPPGIALDSYPGHLEQVFNNLIVNSIVHGFDGRSEGTITIAACVEGESVRIDYRDDGVGIASELQQKVFEAFYSTKFGKGGSGLGLFIVRRLLCNVLKGEVKLDSTPGAGVHFAIKLPLKVPA